VFSILLPIHTLATASDSADINVVYPKQNQHIGAIDSTFIFGSVNPAWKLTVNGFPTPVDKDGGWLAFVPLSPGEFIFKIIAAKGTRSDTVDWPVKVPDVPVADKLDSLVIFQDYRLPTLSRSVQSGDILRLQFRGTPNCRGWAEIPGVVDSIPMSEALGVAYPYHAGDVFDTSTATTDSALLVPGIYQGLYRFSLPLARDSARIILNLTAPGLPDSIPTPTGNTIMGIDIGLMRSINWGLMQHLGSVANDTAKSTLSFNPEEYPHTIEFTDTTQRLRVAPARGYLGLFQPAGVRALAVGFEGDWYRLKLSETRFGYVEMSRARALAPGVLPPHSRLSSLRSEANEKQLTISAQLSGKHPFSITEPDSRTLIVELFGVTMDTDWFRYDYRDTFLTSATWTQPEPELFRLKLHFATPLWGYHAGYQGNVFELQLKYPPTDIHSLRGKTIVVDPGHNPDPGSIGPTGYTEAEANLAIALLLRDELRRRGATVVMTRTGDKELALYDRPKVADSVDADLFVSVHNNALPDGENPFVNYGVSTYFYHSHSQTLASSIHKKMIALGGQKDHGFYHGNLAVLRPTERPSALVECGFMILPKQERLLKTKSYRRKVARAIAQGIEEFFEDFGK